MPEDMELLILDILAFPVLVLFVSVNGSSF